jgi:hypothetical protein
MDKETIRVAFEEANELSSGLPQHLQAPAFELAVGLLLSGIPSNAGTPAPKVPVPPFAPQRSHRDGPAVSDLLKVCKDNLDRIVVFMHDCEEKGDEITPDSLMLRFATYKQDRPKNIYRDLAKLPARDWAEQHGKERGSPWILKRKGRERFEELVLAVNE